MARHELFAFHIFGSTEQQTWTRRESELARNVPRFSRKEGGALVRLVTRLCHFIPRGILLILNFFRLLL